MEVPVYRRTPLPAGYGYTTPLTDAGKAFSIVFALLGVPTTMLLLTASAQRLSLLLTHAPLSWLSLRWGWHPQRAARWHLVALLVVIVAVFFLVPAAVFAYLEEAWSFLDAFYFCFISLSTIGLGDYVPGEAPGQPYRALYKVLVTGELCSWLGICGLAVGEFSGRNGPVLRGVEGILRDNQLSKGRDRCRTTSLLWSLSLKLTHHLAISPSPLPHVYSIPFPGPGCHGAGAADFPQCV